MMEQRYQEGERGQDLVEFALVLPLLLLLVLGMAEISLVVLRHNTLSNAVREGARVGVIAGATQQQACEAVRSRALGLVLICPADQTQLQTCPPADPNGICVRFTTDTRMVQVVANYQHRLLTGALLDFFINPVLPMRAGAEMRRE